MRGGSLNKGCSGPPKNGGGGGGGLGGSSGEAAKNHYEPVVANQVVGGYVYVYYSKLEATCIYTTVSWRLRVCILQ